MTQGKLAPHRINSAASIDLRSCTPCLPSRTGLECFEGMKAYRSISANHTENQIRMFRPECNMQRLSDSMHRLHFECYDFNQNELLECIKELIRVDENWIPDGEGYSLYIRPTMIGTNPFL
jgi:branched-chain amino acid aminotransferase